MDMVAGRKRNDRYHRRLRFHNIVMFLVNTLPGCDVSMERTGTLVIFHMRFWLTCLCFLGPEITVVEAAGQWHSACNSVRAFQDANISGWTMQHAFFADMGGYMLHAPDFPPFPVDAKQLLFLIRRGFVELPCLDKKIIEDKNKVDGMLRIITILQVSYFAASTAGRAVTHLAITCLELTTAAFIVCTLASVFFWIHKPADVRTSVPIHSSAPITEIVKTALAQFEASSEKINVTRDGLDRIRSPHIYYRTPLDLISRKEWHWSLYWSNWINILRHLRINFAPKTLPTNRFENTTFLYVPPRLYCCILRVTTIYSGIFVAAWNYEFPTPIEQYLWRAATLTIFGTLIAFTTVSEIGFELYPALRRRLERTRPPRTSVVVAHKQHGWLGTKLRRAAAGVRNNSIAKDPALDVPLKAILPIYVVGVFYCTARTYILLSDLFELRLLPASAYSTVDWLSLIPHLN